MRCSSTAREAQKQTYLPAIADGTLRLQAFSITEPEAGSDTTDIATTATRDGDDYVISGHKNWTSRIEQSDLALVLARTTPRPTIRASGPGGSACSWSTCATSGVSSPRRWR